MDRDEQIGAGIAGDADAATKRDESVIVAGQLHPHPAAAFQPPRRQPGDGQRHILFIATEHADRPGILAAMARIDDNQRLAARPRPDAGGALARRRGHLPGFGWKHRACIDGRSFCQRACVSGYSTGQHGFSL